MTVKETWNPGEIAWFEYHCFESPESCDAPIWYRSHQQVTVLNELVDTDGYDWKDTTTLSERGEDGIPRVYRARFADGLEWDLTEDELFTSRDDFYRPDPPQAVACAMISA